VHSTPQLVEDHFVKKEDDINDREQDEEVTPDDEADNILSASQEE